MTGFRSFLFNVLFYANLVLFLVLGSPLLAAPRAVAMRALRLWAKTSLVLLRLVCGTGMEVRGLENLPRGPLLVAGKHQSFWETFAILPLLDDPCMILKRELTLIPLFGWFALKFRMIAVEREEGPQALRRMMKRAKEEIAAGRQIVIMPEGTRRAPGAPPAYKPGAAALYGALGVACVPFGLNAGVFWPRRSFLRRPGTIVLEFCPALPSGLPRAEFQKRLEEAIETSSNRLLAEAKQN
jgi:1-acyl-sn-glycerol-3-phosphate acyltransferase